MRNYCELLFVWNVQYQKSNLEVTYTVELLRVCGANSLVAFPLHAHVLGELQSAV